MSNNSPKKIELLNKLRGCLSFAVEAKAYGSSLQAIAAAITEVEAEIVELEEPYILGRMPESIETPLGKVINVPHSEKREAPPMKITDKPMRTF